MTSAPTHGTLNEPPGQDVLALAQACNTRLLEREGIAMFVALDDLRDNQDLVVADENALNEGQQLATLLDHYHAGLTTVAPPSEELGPDPTGARELIAALVVLSEQHLRARTGTP